MSAAMVTSTIGSKGSITLPKSLREAFGLRDGSLVILQQCEDGVLIRPAVAMPRDTETYSPRRRAEFLLNNAVTPEDYAWARGEAERLGVDPDTVDHHPPPME
ncbi:MAG: AbrB/MazE/SpoVT family DNA-binding domain-containing protein [Phycisphaerales bacterium]|nr:AbrB/MazE/SpoVT family DNA-binding domain-containing protein [Phycisphaerales bacterium]